MRITGPAMASPTWPNPNRLNMDVRLIPTTPLSPEKLSRRDFSTGTPVEWVAVFMRLKAAADLGR